MSCDVGEVTERFGEWAELYLRHNSFSNSSVASTTSQLILQPFRHFTYVTAHSPTLPSLYQRHNSLSNSSVASRTLPLILQPLHHFTYVTDHSPTLLSLFLRHRLLTYVTWWTAHRDMDSKDEDKISGHSTVERISQHCLFTEMEEG